MAYFTQEMKKSREPAIKSLLKEFNLKGSLSVDNHSCVVLTIREGVVDFGATHINVNVYWISEDKQGIVKEILEKAYKILDSGNYQRSNVGADYADVGWYVSIKIGSWDKPYKLITQQAA